jgi:hypothetical protein
MTQTLVGTATTEDSRCIQAGVTERLTTRTKTVSLCKNKLLRKATAKADIAEPG